MSQQKPMQSRQPMRDISAPTQRVAAIPPKKSLKHKLTHYAKRLNKRQKQVLIVFVVVVLGFFVYNYIQTRNELKRASDPQAAVNAEAKKLAGEIGKFVELPSDETPTVATVKNVTELRSQVFFERAQNGDKVLIYPVAKRAVLYRPSTKKIIEYAPVENSTNQ